MNSNYDKLFDFLVKNAKYSTIVVPNMELIRPFFDMAEKGAFKFGKAEDLNPTETAEAISLAIGQPITKIIPVSESNPFPKPEWMSDIMYIKARFSFWDSLGDSLVNSLGYSLVTSLGDNLENSLGQSYGVSLWDSLCDDLGDSLQPSLYINLGTNHGGNLGYSLGTSLFFFLGFVLLNETNKIEQLKPLVRHLSNGYIPIGFKADEPPETYLVMVA